MKWHIDLGPLDKRVSGRFVWIVYAAFLPAGIFILVGAAALFRNPRDTEALAMLLGGLCVLAAAVGLTFTGYQRHLSWAIGIGWAGLLAFATLLDYGPRLWSVASRIPAWMAGSFASGWDLLASITRLEWILLIAAWLVLRALARLSRQIQMLIELTLRDSR